MSHNTSDQSKLRKVEVYSIFNHKPEFMRLQFESIRKYILDKNFEYIVLNNARNPGLRQAVKSISKRERGFVRTLINFSKTLLRRIRINQIAKDLGVRVIKVSRDGSQGSKSIYPSRIVAYTLNWFFKHHINQESRDRIVCFLDSDMFMISPISVEKILGGSAIGIIPQYRGSSIRYLWTGFFVLDLSKSDQIEEIDFSVVEIDGNRCDVGGKTYYYLNKSQPTETQFEFVNLDTVIEMNGIIEVEVNINGNASLRMCYDEDFKVIDLEVKSGHAQLEKVIGSESEIVSNYGKLVIKCVELCKGLELNPKNIDLIRQKSDHSDDFFILHYKNGSNPADFDNKTYFERKMQWCASMVRRS